MTARRIKHARGVAKHEAFMSEYVRSGLEALRKDRQRRIRQNYHDWKDRHEKAHLASKKGMVDECPWCIDIMKAEKKQREEMEAALAETNKKPLTGVEQALEDGYTLPEIAEGHHLEKSSA